MWLPMLEALECFPWGFFVSHRYQISATVCTQSGATPSVAEGRAAAGRGILLTGAGGCWSRGVRIYWLVFLRSGSSGFQSDDVASSPAPSPAIPSSRVLTRVCGCDAAHATIPSHRNASFDVKTGQ